MLTARPIALLAALLAAGGAAAAPITVTNGESFLLTYGVNDGSNFEFKSTYPGDWGGQTPGAFTLAGDSSVVNFFGDGGTASAAASHTASLTGISITGSTAAGSTAGGQYVGQIAADDTGVVSTDFSFGYYLEFTLDAATALLLTVDGKTGAEGDGAYADFGAIVFDSAFNQLYALGGTSSGSFSELFTLGPGTYFLFAQSQSSVNGQGAASASASFTVSLAAVEPVPEPISLVAFGGLLAGGGLAVRRARRG
jgi:hypothetical protein